MLLAKKPRGVAITFSTSKWGQEIALNPTLTSFRTSSPRSPIKVRKYLHSHSSAGCRSLTLYTCISWSTSPRWERLSLGHNHTFIWRRQWRFFLTPQQSLARTERNQSLFAKLPITLLTNIGATLLQEAGAIHNPVKSNPELQVCRAFYSIEAPSRWSLQYFQSSTMGQTPKAHSGQSVAAWDRDVLLVPRL